jgi:hypothetical protein
MKKCTASVSAVFEGFGRGDPDLQLHQSIPPLSEENPLDLDLEVIG